MKKNVVHYMGSYVICNTKSVEVDFLILDKVVMSEMGSSD